MHCFCLIYKLNWIIILALEEFIWRISKTSCVLCYESAIYWFFGAKQMNECLICRVFGIFLEYLNFEKAFQEYNNIFLWFSKYSHEKSCRFVTRKTVPKDTKLQNKLAHVTKLPTVISTH